MKPIRLALAIAAAAMATTLLAKRRGPAVAASLDAAAPGQLDMHGALDGAYGTDGSGPGADSPNQAERLQGSGAAATPAPADDLFAATPQQGADARAPGLPDFFRGA